jgi:hypothetical protein
MLPARAETPNRAIADAVRAVAMMPAPNTRPSGVQRVRQAEAEDDSQAERARHLRHAETEIAWKSL